MEDNLPLVTVVTPTFNLIKNGREDVFIECINSVKNQSYKNIEHIFIDNASEDGTVELLKKYNLTFFSEPDTGIYNAFNKGVQKANGKYVIFLGSDDYYHSTFGIEMSVKALELESADLSYAESLLTFDNINTLVFEVNLLNAFKLIPFSHQAVMCKRDLLIETPFDESYKISGDVHWHIRVMLKKYKVVNTNFNFVYNRFVDSTAISNYEIASKETDRLYKELFSDIYPLSEETLHEMSFYRIFPKELDEYFSTFFEDPQEYLDFAEEYSKSQEQLKQFKLIADLIQRSKELDGRVVSKLEKQFNINYIDNILYSKLDNESKKIFLDFFLKRFGNLNTLTQNEEDILDALFKKANKLANERESIETPMNIHVNNMDFKYLSPTPVNQTNLTNEQELICYFDIVHTFFLKEYDLEDFRSKDGGVILDCGAYTGDTALLFSSIYPNSPIYSFECEDVQFSYLEENIRINNLTNVYAEKYFLSNTTKDNMLKIDDFVQQNSIENVGMIKFDIEGAERDALEGAVETIKKYKPILIIPIYHIPDDCMVIPQFIEDLNMPATFKLKWLDKRVWGVDCSLFVKFE